MVASMPAFNILDNLCSALARLCASAHALITVSLLLVVGCVLFFVIVVAVVAVVAVVVVAVFVVVVAVVVAFVIVRMPARTLVRHRPRDARLDSGR